MTDNALVRTIGYKAGEAVMLNNIGWSYCLRSDYHEARTLCRQSLTLNVECGGDRQTDGAIWDSLGYIEHHLGNFTEAMACYERSLAICQEFGNRLYGASALTHLGDTRYAVGDLAGAREAWQQSLVIFEDLGPRR